MNYENKTIVVSVSGGKDSTAMCLNLFEKGYTKDDFVRVFADTGWEHKNTYAYLDELEKTIGKIHRVQHLLPLEKIKPEYHEHILAIEKRLGFESPMVRRAFRYLFFPTRMQKYCTKEFKINPIFDFFETLDDDFVNLVGIRKEESPRRSKMIEWEWNEHFDCWTHRPLIDWTEKDVIDIHHRFGLIPNRLYLNGSTRVGCYPCINSRKSEIKRLDDDRVSIIRDMEIIFSEIRIAAGKKPATFFDPPVKGTRMAIDDVMEWSRTTRGGKQFELFDTEEETCVRWAMCGV